MGKYKYIKDEEMDIIAETILKDAEIFNINCNEPKKIDIDKLIEFKFDLEIVWKGIDHFSTNGVVLAAIDPKHKIIYMNETKLDIFEEKIGTMNFSKAHELGHWVLHVTEQKEYEQLKFLETDTYYCRNLAKINSEEYQANMFAASILMPKTVISYCINEIKKVRKITFKDLYNLADDFEVSISALVKRVNTLNLLYIDDKGKIHENKEVLYGQLRLY